MGGDPKNGGDILAAEGRAVFHTPPLRVFLAPSLSTKVLITQPFFELLTSDFPWKFIWTVEPNDKVQKYKKYNKYKSTKQKSTKIQKYKNTKKCKKYKKMQKFKKRKEHKKYNKTRKTWYKLHRG